MKCTYISVHGCILGMHDIHRYVCAFSCGVCLEHMIDICVAHAYLCAFGVEDDTHGHMHIGHMHSCECICVSGMCRYVWFTCGGCILRDMDMGMYDVNCT